MADSAIISESMRSWIVKILLQRWNQAITDITPLGNGKNNFVFLVQLQSLERGSINKCSAEPKPGTQPLPIHVKTVVMRISDPAALLDENNRVQNEVAAMTLFRDVLSRTMFKGIVPVIYDWQSISDDGSHGWILMQYLHGSTLQEAITGFSLQLKQRTLSQLADILHEIQTYVLPESIKQFGGIRFDESNNIIATSTTFPCGGPFRSLSEMHGQMVRKQLEIIDGAGHQFDSWRSRVARLRERIERFASEGLERLVSGGGLQRMTLIHGDLDVQNILVDEDGNVTALLDFDFSFIGCTADEFMLSFPELGGLVSGPFEDGEMKSLRKSLLYGFPRCPLEKEEGIAEWETAYVLDQAFSRAGVVRPCEIEGMKEYSCLVWFLQGICPPYLMMDRWLAKRNAMQIEGEMDRCEKELEMYLERWGY